MFSYKDLQKFPIKLVQNDNTLIFYGQTRSGKTTCALGLYRSLIGVKGSITDNDQVVVYTTQINKDVMKAGFNTNKVFLEEDLTPEHVLQHRKPRTLFVFDDILSNNFKYSEELKKIFCTGRHDCISVIICVQYYTLLNPVWRENATFSFMTRCDSNDSYKQFIKDNLSYAPVQMNKKHEEDRKKHKFLFWENVLSDQKRIESYHTLVKCKNTGNSVFIYKAPILPMNRDYILRAVETPTKKSLLRSLPEIEGYINYPLKPLKLKKYGKHLYLLNVTFELTKDERIDNATLALLKQKS